MSGANARESSKNKHDPIEFFPAFAFRDPSDDVERCQHAYRRVVGRAASGDGALALAGEVAALRDVIVAVRTAPQRHYATDPRRDLCHVGRLEEISTFSHVAPAGI